METQRHVLVIRFSALGDVAMTVPVIRLLLQQNPQLQITYLSVANVAPLFEGIERLHFYAADLKGAHKGIRGLYRLHRELKSAVSFDSIADLHQVVRTKILRLFFAPFVKQVAVLDKGRKEKKELTRIRNKVFKPLLSTFERYARVFQQLGFPLDLGAPLEPAQPVTTLASLQALKEEGYYLVGVAPFAKHQEKMYPLAQMKEVLQLLGQYPKVKIFLLGGRSEAATLEQWEQEFPTARSWAGIMSFKEEIAHISELDVMVSMDSANMHLASLVGVPVVSIWGATHPYAGFFGWNQSLDNAVQVALYCRPCSVFGNRPCYRGDHACMRSIEPSAIYDRIMHVLKENPLSKNQMTGRPGRGELS
ncbi:MAG TPA: glycosyltransferase family 9 protein [Flavisolibacter sp.]